MLGKHEGIFMLINESGKQGVESCRSKIPRKPWPANCLWPEPLWDGKGDFWDACTIDLDYLESLGEEGAEYAEIKKHMDELVEEGRLNPDFSLNEDYIGDDEEEDELFTPEIGEDYWNDGFDIDSWEEDVSSFLNCLKLASVDSSVNSAYDIMSLLSLTIDNENLLRQAFTRRAFSIEYGLSACSEELEFYGDQILSTIVTRVIYKKFSDTDVYAVDAPFQSLFAEGDLSKLRSQFVSKEYLASRAIKLGLDKYILYGTGEEPSESTREDMMEALIGAVAVDTNWNWRLLEDVVDRLVNIQLSNPDKLLRPSSYDTLNSWHQKQFGYMPEYEVYRDYRDKAERIECYYGVLRYSVPTNNKGIREAQRIECEGAISRSAARESLAKQAISFIQNSGLWMNLADVGVEPDLDKSINQLQEMFQKKYVSEPVYTFKEGVNDQWLCECICGEFIGTGVAESKVKAKKKAAYTVLVWIMDSAGICKKEWKETMWKIKMP